MKFSILVKNEDHKEFLPKIPESIKHLKLFINMEIRRASLVILFSFKRKDSIKEEVQELDFLETVSKLVKLGYFSDINLVSSILSDKQFLCFYLHDILDFKSTEIANLLKIALQPYEIICLMLGRG
ncbi:MAG: hypothetical protein ACTSRR_13445 [Candidatus Heimdallarchaeaceae archaeon]